MLMNDFASACSFTRAAASNNLASERLDASAGLLNYRQITKLPLQTGSELNIGTVPMYGFGRRHGGQFMPRVQLPAVTQKR